MRDDLKKTLLQMWKEYWLSALLAAAWTVISRYLFPHSNPLPIASDFFITFIFLNFFTANFFRVNRQQQDRTILTTVQAETNKISAATDKIVADVTTALQQAREQAKTNEFFRPIVQNLTTLSTAVSTQVRDIRTANNAVVGATGTMLGAAGLGGVGTLRTDTQVIGPTGTWQDGAKLAAGATLHSDGPVIPGGTSEDLTKSAAVSATRKSE